MKFLLTALLGLAVFTLPANSENILIFMGFGSHSHRIAIQPFAEALASKGHNVSFVVSNEYFDNSSSVHYFAPAKLVNYFKNIFSSTGVNFYNSRVQGGSGFLRVLFVQQFGLKVCENVYADEGFNQWLSTTPHFDLVIMDSLFNECGYGIAHAHGAKTMVFSISTILPWISEAAGIPDESSFIPELMSSIPLEMNFLQRMVGALTPVFWRLYRRWVYFPKMESISKAGLKIDNLPSFEELERNTSLILVNSHAAQEFPRALPPNVIPVGGISWSNKRKPLPQKYEDFINQGKEGFIYVSFGSFIDFLTFPDEVQQTFIRALKRFPNIQFIWKLNKVPNDLPNHIMVEKWLPQQDILFHTKIKGFITHSGIGGVNEAIYSSVPLICFPTSSEQDYNAQLVVQKGFGIKMEITALTEDDLVNSIQNLITNKHFKENALRVTKQFMDRPMKALDTAV